MKLLSNVPASAAEMVADAPFAFEIKGWRFEIQPLSLRQYQYIEDNLHDSVLQVLYYKALDSQDLINLMEVGADRVTQIKQAESFLDVILGLIIQHSYDDKIKMVQNDMVRNEKVTIERVQPLSLWDRLCKKEQAPNYDGYLIESIEQTFREWFEYNLSMRELIDLTSYLLRYSVEIKKKLSKALQQGVISITQERQTNSPITYKESRWDSLSPGGVGMIAEWHGSESIVA